MIKVYTEETKMSNLKLIKPKGGLDLKLVGSAEKIIVNGKEPDVVAIKPTDFKYIVPKLLKKEGDKVKIGTPIFFDKKNNGVTFVSQVSGEITKINRGEKRKILNIEISNNKKYEKEKVELGSVEELSKEEIINILIQKGFWPYIIKRPYGCIADPTEKPKAIYVSLFDNTPLPVDYDLILDKREDDFKTGIEILNKITGHEINLGISEKTSLSYINDLVNVKTTLYKDIYPSCNVGFQIHKTNPINKGDVIWTINPQDLCTIGRFFNTKEFDFSKIIAISGANVKSPKYYKTISGNSSKAFCQDNIKENISSRLIVGSVLSGEKIDAEKGYLGFYSNSLSVIPNQEKISYLSWLTPNFSKFSTSKTFFSWLTPNKKYNLSTTNNGEERAFVITGRYEEVISMDIYPMQLLKAIMANDIELMENLGIYEVIEEDLAGCEFVCTSKIDIQNILSSGLENLRKEYLTEEE